MRIGLRGAKEVIIAVYSEVQRTRVFNVAAGLTFLTGGLMAVAMLLTLAGNRAGHFLASVFHLSNIFEWTWPSLRWGIIVSCIVLSMEFLYFLGPNIKQRFKDTLPGALLG